MYRGERSLPKFAPRWLTLKKNKKHLTACQDLKNRSTNPNFFKKKNIIISNETSFYGYHLETKASFSEKQNFCLTREIKFQDTTYCLF